MIDLTVKTLDSQNHAFSLEDDQITVRRFKEHIAESVAVPADSQRLIYCGRVLQDEKKLNDYDVNGKVIHLVQSAPPQPGQRNNDSGQAQGQHSQGWQNQQRSHYRFSHAQMHGNAMYLGAMSVPAEIIEGHGLPVPQLSNSLSNSRLIVAKRMLNRANELMDRLDDPTAPLHPNTSENNQSPLPQQIQVQEIETDQEELFRTVEGRQSAGTRLSEAVAAALGVAISASGASNVTLLRGSNDDSNEARSASETQEDAEMESSVPSQSEQQGTSNASGQNNRRPHAQLPRPPQMAYLLDRLLSTQDRLRPYIERYRVLMLADPSLPPGAGPEGVEENQRIVDGVSECLHYISHSCHALSDIIVDMRQQPPRNLRCRPIIIQHSAIVQAGVPIQVEAHISLHGRNANNNNGNEESTESSNAQQPDRSDIVVASGSIEVTTEDNNQSQESNSTPPSQPAEQQRSQEPSQSQFVFDLPNNVEVLMEVSPDSNMEASSGSEQNQTGENNNNNNAGRTSGNGAAGIFPWGSAPTPDFLRNLMQAVAGHMAQGGIATVPITTRTAVTTAGGGGGGGAGGVQQTVAATVDSTSTNAAQSTQARSNVGTHPTTATQTRSTSRPHVFHPSHPLGVGMSMGQGLEFDPFLPCNSHHIRRTPTSTPNVTATSQSTRSSQTPAQETQPQAQTATTTTASSTASSTSTTSPTSSQGAANNPLANLLRQMLGGTSGQQQANISINSNSSDLPESLGNIMQMVGSGNIHIGIMGDGGANVVGGNVTLANLLEIGSLQSRENITEENLLAELALLIARYMTLEDLIRLRRGRSGPIARLRVPLRFLCCVIMNNSSMPEERDQLVERLILQIRPHLQQLLEREEDAGGRSGSQVDICATIESLLSRHCKEMLRLILDVAIDDRRFGEEILTIINNLGRQLCAVLRYSLRGGQAGLESIACSCMCNMLGAVNPSFRQWMLNSFIVHFRTYSLRIPQPPDSEILPLLVYKDTNNAQTTSASSTVSNESTCSTQEQSQQPQQQQQQQQQQSQSQQQQSQQSQQSQHEPMETETVEEKSNNEASAPDEGEDITEFPGHEALPSEWIPIIARDGVRQRRQLQMQGMANGAVTTFSDAYIGGLPTKRRKLIEQQKPRLLVSPTPNHSAITASVERLVREGVSRAGIEEVDGAAVAVATDPGVRRAFGQAIRDCLNPHRYGTPDFPDPLRFPNATKYFSDQERSSK